MSAGSDHKRPPRFKKSLKKKSVKHIFALAVVLILRTSVLAKLAVNIYPAVIQLAMPLPSNGHQAHPYETSQNLQSYLIWILTTFVVVIIIIITVIVIIIIIIIIVVVTLY
jgi:hypothetical protein